MLDAKLIGTGNLFKYIISKKRAPFERFSRLADVMLYSDETYFEEKEKAEATNGCIF